MREQSFGWDFKPRSILVTHAFDLVGIKRSWHSTEGGFVIVGVERVSVTNKFPSFKFQILEVSCHSLTIIDLVGWQQNTYGPSEAEFKHKNREKK